jgi:eukaryotic-like serine/threonine-protein kinase
VPVAAAVLLVLLAAGSLVSAWLIRGEQENTQAAYDRERQRAEEAEQRFQLARRSVDEMIRLTEEELADHPHLHGLRKRLLESALEYYQEFMKQRRDDPDAQKELAVTRDRVQKILGDLAALQGAGRLFLLKNDSVLEDLRATAEQRERIRGLLPRQDAHRDELFREFGQLTPGERQRRFLELARADEAAVAAILSLGQLQRLGQIALQSRGPLAFREPDVAAALKLTAEQRERIRTIEEDFFFRKWDGPRFGPPPKGPPGEAHGQAFRDAVKRIQAVLTKEQAKRWREMVGEPFTGRIAFRLLLPPRPGGPPSRPPGPPPGLPGLP